MLVIGSLMDRALSLARGARGHTGPNPPVGAVLERDGTIVGEGYSQPPGGLHAEAVAIEEAGSSARGATLYVTLEPCTHWGRTPPCVDALLEAGIVEAHVALLDPNPRVNGTGIGRLESAGITVRVGEGAEQAAQLIEAHRIYMLERRPFVTVVTALPDDLLGQLVEWHDIVLAGATRDPVSSNSTPLFLVTDGSGDQRPRIMGFRAGNAERQGLEPLPRVVEGHSYTQFMRELGRLEIASALVLDSPELAEALFDARLVDKIILGTGDDLPPDLTAQ